MEQHTPGKWHVTAGADCLEVRCSLHAIRGPNDHLANVLMAGAGSRPDILDMARANAKLMAAAPELLEALQAIVAHKGNDLPQHYIDVATDAINKAISS